jgi:hypothetical protein
MQCNLIGIRHLTAVSARPRTDFATEELTETPGEKPALPPLLEPGRAEIERGRAEAGRVDIT